jgi:hypothetical protein
MHAGANEVLVEIIPAHEPVAHAVRAVHDRLCGSDSGSRKVVVRFEQDRGPWPSEVIATLIKAARHVTGQGGAFELQHIDPANLNVLRMMRLDAILPAHGRPRG